MLSKIFSSATYGIDAFIIEVETNVEEQIPGFALVGLMIKIAIFKLIYFVD